MPLDGSNPALVRTDNGYRLPLDHRFERHRHRIRRFGDFRAALAEHGFGPELLLQLGDLVGQSLLTPGLVLEQPLEGFLLSFEALDLLTNGDLLETSQRAQAHVQDRVDLIIIELPAFLHHRARIILLADDRNHLIEIEEHDHVALEHVEPVGDLAQTEIRAPHQYIVAMIKIGLQHLPQGHHPGHMIGIEHVHVE